MDKITWAVSKEAKESPSSQVSTSIISLSLSLMAGKRWPSDSVTLLSNMICRTLFLCESVCWGQRRERVHIRPVCSFRCSKKRKKNEEEINEKNMMTCQVIWNVKKIDRSKFTEMTPHIVVSNVRRSIKPMASIPEPPPPAPPPAFEPSLPSAPVEEEKQKNIRVENKGKKNLFYAWIKWKMNNWCVGSATE